MAETEEVNLLSGMSYTVSSNIRDLADDNVKATDGKYRGDGTNQWNGDTKSDVSIEWMGTGKWISYTFSFDSAANVNRVVFKSMRLASNRQFGTVTINNGASLTTAELEKNAISGAPLYTSEDGTIVKADQYFDVTIPVELNGVTELTVYFVTEKYCCQYDEIEAYGNFIPEESSSDSSEESSDVSSSEEESSDITSSEESFDSSEDESFDSSEESSDAPTTRKNLLLKKTYTISSDAEMADDGVKATDGFFRGDGISEWNGDLKGDASIEWQGTSKNITYTFNFTQPTNIDTIIFKSTRLAINRQFGAVTVNGTYSFTAAQLEKLPVDGAPTYSEDGSEQYFDIVIPVDLKKVTQLTISLVTDAYCCQYDEIEAYGNNLVSEDEYTGPYQLGATAEIEGDSAVTLGDIFALNVYVNNIDTPNGAVALDLPISYDKELLKLVSVTPIVPDSWGTGYINLSPSQLTAVPFMLSLACDADDLLTNSAYYVKEDGILGFTLSFEAIAEGEAVVKVINDDSSNTYAMVVDAVGFANYGVLGTKHSVVIEEDPGYTVIFKDKDGEEIDRQVVEEGGTATEATAPEVEGFNFIGWYDEDGNKVEVFTNITADMTLTATYEQIMLKLNFVAENATLSFTELEVAYGTDFADIGYPEVTPDEGYGFKGWDIISGIIKEDNIVMAIVELNSYTVSFVGFDGEELYTQTISHGGSADAPEVPYREGFNALGWADEDGEIVTDFSGITEDMTLTATYEQIMLKLNFVAENATLSFTETEVAYGTNLADVQYPEVSTDEGYGFKGWDVISGIVKEDIIIMAIVELNSYTVSFVGFDGEELYTQTISHGGSADAPEVPYREGFNALGWADEDGEIVTDFSGITEDMTFTAAYEQIMIKVIFTADNATLSFTETEVAYGTNFVDIDFPTVTPDEGYHLVGWDENEGTVTEEITINAIVELNSYTVSFVGFDGEELYTQTISHGGSADAPEVPYREGFYALGWADEDGKIVTDFSGITEDMTFTAAYEQIMIKVIFTAHNATLSFTETEVAFGTDLADIDFPTVTPDEGYRLIGWDNTKGAVKEEITVTALIALNSNTVMFMDNSGNVISSQIVMTGFSAIVPEAPVVEGFEFVGWADKDGNIVNDFGNITADMIVTATYNEQVLTYTVLFKAPDGTVISHFTVLDGGTVTPPEAPVIGGYSFVGWTREDGIIAESFDNIGANTTYIACYKVREYTEHFVFTLENENVVVSTEKEYIYFKAGGMTVSNIAALFADEEISVSKANGDLATSEALAGTGYIITSTINGHTESRTVVVLGDINGDGNVSSADYGQAFNCAKGKITLTGVKAEAANVASPAVSGITSADYGLILNFAKNKIVKFTTNVE